MCLDVKRVDIALRDAVLHFAIARERDARQAALGQAEEHARLADEWTRLELEVQISAAVDGAWCVDVELEHRVSLGTI